MSPIGHARHHRHFYVALLAGAGCYALTAAFDRQLAPLLAGDVFFAIYLLSAGWFVVSSSVDTLRRRADVEDEGAYLITLLTIAAICFCLGSLFSLIGGGASHTHLLVSLASVPLGWLSLHTLVAFHYAHLYYESDAAPGQGLPRNRKDRGGLAFPGTDEPDAWDFLYFSFVIGMTAQVSDVAIEDSRVRRLALVQGLASFFFNTVLLALAVNLAVSAAS